MRKPAAPWATVSNEWIERLAQSGRAIDSMERARREAFLLSHLVLAAGVLIAAPLWIVVNGAPTLGESAIFALAQLPLLSVVALLRLDNLRTAQSIAAFGWLALAAACLFTGAHVGAAAPFGALALIEATFACDLILVSATASAALAMLAVAALTAATGGGFFETLLAAPLVLYVVLLARSAGKVETVRAEAEARNRRDLRLVSEAAGDLVIGFDEGGAVASVVGEAAKAYGLDARELMGRGFFQRVHVGDRPAFLKLVSDAIATGEAMRATLRLRTGHARNERGEFVEPVFHFFEARSSLVEAADGERSAGVVCILRDVTAQRHAAETIEAARRESEMAAAGKTRFLANVSHELRTPLNAIIGFSEMLASEQLAPADPAKRREYAEIIRNSGQHLLAVVNTILDMSKIESGSMQLSPEPFSLPELVDQCVSMMQLKAEQGQVTLSRDYPERLEEIVGDKRACKQILINLLSNAVKFTPANGRVRIRLAPDGNCLALSVTDSGIGISASDLGRLGDPFFQASASHDRAYEGTGLGLSVVRGLVGLHGGTIAVESAPRSGTSVTVRLPLDCRPFQNKAPALARIETIARRGVIRPAEELEAAEDRVKKIA
ncbi:PAS domain-containing sensor histidine kinase [Methylosinus sp. R-45379]|uniref:sensor histidine kinase n=1 Tax=Methylosinus sp. R-45379 TaxID=980563 RepID=UPI000A4E4263|nr:PAS domain-containing sensor histidine kinase [Methylosinus sp. R-45379]